MDDFEKKLGGAFVILDVHTESRISYGSGNAACIALGYGFIKDIINSSYPNLFAPELTGVLYIDVDSYPESYDASPFFVSSRLTELEELSNSDPFGTFHLSPTVKEWLSSWRQKSLCHPFDAVSTLYEMFHSICSMQVNSLVISGLSLFDYVLPNYRSFLNMIENTFRKFMFLSVLPRFSTLSPAASKASILNCFLSRFWRSRFQSLFENSSMSSEEEVWLSAPEPDFVCLTMLFHKLIHEPIYPQDFFSTYVYRNSVFPDQKYVKGYNLLAMYRNLFGESLGDYASTLEIPLSVRMAAAARCLQKICIELLENKRFDRISNSD